MTPWMIELKGERFDLPELLRLNSLVDIHIEEKDGRFYLKTEDFNLCSNPMDVLNRGKEILKVINGSAQVADSDWDNVEVIGVARDESNGIRTQFLLASPVIIQFKGRAELSVGGKNVKSMLESFLETSRNNENVEKALRIYGSREHNWSNLYIIYEIIESDIGGTTPIENNGWSSKAKIRKFKYTANSVTAAGDDARHGKETKAPPPSPMLLSEAESFIRNMLRQWLLTK